MKCIEDILYGSDKLKELNLEVSNIDSNSIKALARVYNK